MKILEKIKLLQILFLSASFAILLRPVFLSADSAAPTSFMPNPASVNCVRQGGTLEIRREANGEVGYCKFADGSECEEWALFRGECTKKQRLE